MNAFRETFRCVIEEMAPMQGLKPVWTRGDDLDVVVFPKQCPDGFEVRLECFDYGVYPLAEGWHSGAWDVTVWKPEELKRSLREFINSVVVDAVLHVHESNGKPYKWVLEYQFEGKRISDETDLFFFNWFGRRTRKKYFNGPGPA